MGGNQVARNILKPCKGLQSRSAISPIVLMILEHREAVSNGSPVQSIESSPHPFTIAEFTSCGNVLWLAEIDLDVCDIIVTGTFFELAIPILVIHAIQTTRTLQNLFKSTMLYYSIHKNTLHTINVCG
jgi:hypothetical protein